MRIALTGASGFIGKKLVETLKAAGHQIVTLGRSAGTDFRWETNAEAPPQAFEGTDAVIHLAGEPVAQRWTPEIKQRIRDSRVQGTQRLVQALSITANRPKAFICASAVGYYGDRGEEALPESARPGTGFLPDVCREWEAQADLAAALGMRVVKVRTGVVLGNGGGALEKMLPPFKAFVGGTLGSGKQWTPWIHLDDIVGIFHHAVEAADCTGPLNGAAPGIVTNAAFTAELAHAIHRPGFLQVPEFAIKLLYGEMAGVVLASQRVIPDATLRHYRFQYPELAPALASLHLD